MKKGNKKETMWLLLGMAKVKVYIDMWDHRLEAETSGKFTVDMTRLGWAL